MAEPPSKRFRFDARSASAALHPAANAASSSAGGSHGHTTNNNTNNNKNNNNNNHNKFSNTANRNNSENDPWGDDLVFDEEFEREFVQICSQNVSTVVDMKRTSSHPSQQQQQPEQQQHHQYHLAAPQQEQQRASGVPASPTIRRSVSNQSTSGFSYVAAAAPAVSAAAAAGSSRVGGLPRSNAPTSSSSSSQYYNFQQQRRHPAPAQTSAVTSTQQQPGAVRYSTGSSAAASVSTLRKPSGPDAVAELRDRLHTVQGQYVALNESYETLKQTLANERAARQKAELDVKKLETERSFSAKEIETLLSDKQSLTIRLRKREEQQQQQMQLQLSQLMNRDVIPPTQVTGQQQQQFPSMASFCSRSPVSGPSPLGLRSPHTPLRPQQQPQQPPPPPQLGGGSPASVTSTEDMDYDENGDVAVSASATPGESDESDSWPVVAKQPESAGCHRRRAELLALYPGLLAQCSSADRAIRCLNRPQHFQHQRQLPTDILDDMPAAAWSPDARQEVADALDCLAKLTTRELEPMLAETSTSGPGEAERLLAPIRSRLSGYLLALRLRGSSAAVCARQLALVLETGTEDSADSDGYNSSSDVTKRRLKPTPVQLAHLGLDALRQLWRLCQLSGEAALGLLRNVGRRETALVADLFDLVRLLPDDQMTACDTEALHCSLRVLHYLLLHLPENRRQQLVEFFCNDFEQDARRRLLRSDYRPSVTLYVEILILMLSRQDGYANLARHNDLCRIAELAQCLELRPNTEPQPDLLQLINTLSCLIRECIAVERLHKADTGVTLLNRDCRERCFYKLICALSNALAQLMPLHYCSTASLDPGLVSSVHAYIRTMDAMKDYLDVQSCKEMVRQDKTHFFIISVVECFKYLTFDNKYEENEYSAPSRPSLDA